MPKANLATVDIQDVPIFRVGEWGTDPVTKEKIKWEKRDLEKIAENHNSQVMGCEAPLLIGHDEQSKIMR